MQESLVDRIGPTADNCFRSCCINPLDSLHSLYNGKTNVAKPKTKKPSKSSQYRVKNWRQYNQALRSRGSLDIWINEEVLAGWQDASAKNTGKRGAPFQYPDPVIELILQLGSVFHQPLRGTQGLVRSILGLLKLELTVPDYTTLSRRRPQLSSRLKTIPKDIVAMIVYSTGRKFIGEGEWKRVSGCMAPCR